MLQQPTHSDLNKLIESGVLEKQNQDRCIHVFYDAAKIIHFRQQRIGKPQLKTAQMASALVLVHFCHFSLFKFDVTGQLACNFIECTEAQAVEYFSQSVLGSVTDVRGRKITIDQGGIKSLYKDSEGRHRRAPENYIPMRGKRLPWIRHVLENAPSIFKIDEKIRGRFQRSYLYAGLATIPLAAGAARNYFLVIVREDSNEARRFLTAFEVGSHNAFLKKLEESVPFIGSHL